MVVGVIAISNIPEGAEAKGIPNQGEWDCRNLLYGVESVQVLSTLTE